MNVCPKAIYIRNSKESSHNGYFQSDRISLEKPTPFGFNEFVSNCPQGLEVQCLFCASYQPVLCGKQWFDSEARNKVCENEITSKSNFHLCLKLPEANDVLYIYFQKKSEKFTQDIIEKLINEFDGISSFNGHNKSNIYVAILFCGLPCCGTDNIAAKNNGCVNLLQQKKIRYYTKNLLTKAGVSRLTFSPSSEHPCSINIVHSVTSSISSS